MDWCEMRNQHPDTTAHLELVALEKMTGALCEYIERLTRDAQARQDFESREADLQLRVFEERRTQALELLEVHSCEPREMRIARLQKAVEALDCSRDYFRPIDAEPSPAVWEIRLR